MKLASLICLLMSQPALPAILKRNTQTVLNDFQQITTQSEKVRTEVNAFNGDLIQALQIYADSNALQSSITQTINDVKALSTLSNSDSAAIGQAVVGLQTNTYGTLNALTSKYPVFAGLTDVVVLVVQSSLKTLQNDTALLGSTLTDKFAPVLAKVSPLITSNIDFHFQRAIDAFST